MTDIFAVYQFISFVCNKQLAGSPTPAEVSRALDFGQQAVFNIYRTKGDEEALRNFIKTPSLTTTSTGVLAYPSDLAETLSIDETLNGVYTGIVEIEESQIQNALASALYPISSNPRYIRGQSGIQIFPATTHTVSLRYLSNPTTPLIAVTVVGNTITYNAAGSTQLAFPNNYWIEIIVHALPSIGVSLKAEEVMALSQTFNQGGK